MSAARQISHTNSTCSGPAVTPRLDLIAYVREFLDGVVGDADASDYQTREAAETALYRALGARIGRELTDSERTRVMITFATAWNERTLTPATRNV